MLLVEKPSYLFPKPSQYSINEYRKRKCIIIYDFKKNETHLIKKIKSKEHEKYLCEQVDLPTFKTKTIELIGSSLLISDNRSGNYYIHYLNTYDELLNINVLPHSTIFSVNIIINGFYLNIYKKISYRKNDRYLNNLLTSFTKFRSKAMDEICKMNEFIYENYEFIYNLIKLKVMFITNVHRVRNRNINELIHININEIDKLRRIMILSEQSCSNPLDIINGENNLIYNFKVKTKCNVLGALSKLSTFALFDNYLILNKENFKKIQNFTLPFANIGSTKKTYVANNVLYVSSNEHTKIINYNKHLNYYYNKSIDGFKKVIPFEETINKNEILIKSFIGIPRVKSNGILLGTKNAYIKSFISINNKINLISNTLIENDLIKSQQTNIDKLLSGLNKFNNIVVDDQCNLNDIIDCVINYKKYRLLRNLGIIINISKLDKIKLAVENINYNYNNKEKIIEIFNRLRKLYYDPTTRNNLLDYFTEEVFMKGLIPQEFKKYANRVYSDKKQGYEADIRTVYIHEMNSVNNINKEHNNELLSRQYHLYLMFMNRKYDKKELDTLEENLRIFSLRCL